MSVSGHRQNALSAFQGAIAHTLNQLREFPSHEWYAGSKGNYGAVHQILCVNDRNRQSRRCHIGKISMKRWSE